MLCCVKRSFLIASISLCFKIFATQLKAVKFVKNAEKIGKMQYMFYSNFAFFSKVSKVDFWRENKDIFEFSRQIWPNIYAYSMIDFWRENSKQQMYLNFRAKNG